MRFFFYFLCLLLVSACTGFCNLSDGCTGSGGGDGSGNPTYGSGVNGQVRTIALASDGFAGLYIGGDFTSVGGLSRSGIARLNFDGSVDTNFNPGLGFNNRLNVICLDSDAIYAGGTFTRFDTTNNLGRIVRLFSSGLIDTVFAVIGGGLDGEVKDVRMHPTSPEVLIAGNFTTYNGAISANNLIKVTILGAPVGGFAPPLFDNTILGMVEGAVSGFIYLVGEFNSVAGVQVEGIVRIDSGDGTVDADFTSAFFNNVTNDIARKLANDGTVVVGRFTTYGGGNSNRGVALDSDGSPTALFSPGLNGEAIVVHLDTTLNEHYVGGDFTSAGGVIASRIVRVDSNGAIVPDFAPGVGFNGAVRAITFAANNAIYVGGDFTSYGGVAVPTVVRLHSSGILDTNFMAGQ